MNPNFRYDYNITIEECQANATEPRTQNDEEDTFNTEFTIRDSSKKLTVSYLNTKNITKAYKQ